MIEVSFNEYLVEENYVLSVTVFFEGKKAVLEKRR
jgi:hypothetical protein